MPFPEATPWTRRSPPETQMRRRTPPTMTQSPYRRYISLPPSVYSRTPLKDQPTMISGSTPSSTRHSRASSLQRAQLPSPTATASPARQSTTLSHSAQSMNTMLGASNTQNIKKMPQTRMTLQNLPVPAPPMETELSDLPNVAEVMPPTHKLPT